MENQVSKSSESGNVLWFILVAIILLGALTILLSRSGSQVDQSGDVEQLRIKTSQLLRTAKSFQTAVEQLKLTGISENEISFDNPVTEEDYENPRCRSNACKIFDVEGAGLVYTSPPVGVNDGSGWIFTGANNVGSEDAPVGTYGVPRGNDLIVLLANVKPVVCDQINRDLEVASPGNVPIETSGVSTAPFRGTYAETLYTLDGDPHPYELEYTEAGCFIDASEDPDMMYFYYVLLVR